MSTVLSDGRSSVSQPVVERSEQPRQSIPTRNGTPTPTPEGIGAYCTEELLKLAEETTTIVPRGTWESLGSEEEIALERGDSIQARPTVRVQLEAARAILLRQRSVHAGFITKEASEDSRDLRAAVNQLYNGTMDVEADAGVQAVPRRREMASQTHFARQVNATVQAQPTLVDACIHHMKDLPPREEPALSDFLARALPRTLHCLTLNREVPIYDDELARFNDEDTIAGAAGADAIMLERGNYTHAACKDRRVTCVSWRSARGRDDCICVASIAQTTLEGRLRAARRCEDGVALVWELSDPMHPRYILEAPNEVQTLHFSPARPNLIAGGSMNGQVFLWDLSHADRALAAGAAGGGRGAGAADVTGRGGAAGVAALSSEPPVPEPVQGVTFVKDGDVLVPRVQPIQISRVEFSHRRPVHDLQWLPSTLECTFDGRQTAVTSGSHQFATVSDDGTVLVWDTRPEYLLADKMRKMRHQIKGSTEVSWVPFLRYQLTRPDGSGDLAGYRFVFNGAMPDESPSYTMAVATTDGEFATCMLVNRHERRASVVVPCFGATRETRCVQHVVPDAHAGPVWSVARHPTIGDVYLTCGDGCFKVWRAGQPQPLFRSPTQAANVTCAVWSPTRAAIVLVGTGDGKVQVWDLLDRSTDPLLVHHMVQDAVTSLCCKPLPPRVNRNFQQHLAIGTNVGSFHWYTLPVELSRGYGRERRQFRQFLEREAVRVAYYNWRWGVRQNEMDRYGAGAAKEVVQKAALGQVTVVVQGGNANESDADLVAKYANDPHRDAEFLEKVELLQKEEEARMNEQQVA